jgi:hypothetical protein
MLKRVRSLTFVDNDGFPHSLTVYSTNKHPAALIHSTGLRTIHYSLRTIHYALLQFNIYVATYAITLLKAQQFMCYSL